MGVLGSDPGTAQGKPLHVARGGVNSGFLPCKAQLAARGRGEVPPVPHPASSEESHPVAPVPLSVPYPAE